MNGLWLYTKLKMELETPASDNTNFDLALILSQQMIKAAILKR